MPSLSIIVPMFGGVEPFERTLVSVLAHRPDDCEVLVVLAAEYADPYELEGEVHFIQAPRGASLPQCVQLGVEQSRAPVVHVLACGLEASEGWAESALNCFADPNVASVSPLVMDARRSDILASAGLGYRASGRARTIGAGLPIANAGSVASQLVGPSLTAAFYRRSALQLCGGFHSVTELGTIADVDLALRLRKARFSTAVATGSILQGSAEHAPRPSRYQSGLEAELLFWRNMDTANRAQSLLSHAALWAGEFARAIVWPFAGATLYGRLAGAIGYRRLNRSTPGSQSSPTIDQQEPAARHPHIRVDRPRKRGTVPDRPQRSSNPA